MYRECDPVSKVCILFWARNVREITTITEWLPFSVRLRQYPRTSVGTFKSDGITTTEKCRLINTTLNVFKQKPLRKISIVFALTLSSYTSFVFHLKFIAFSCVAVGVCWVSNAFRSKLPTIRFVYLLKCTDWIHTSHIRRDYFQIGTNVWDNNILNHSSMHLRRRLQSNGLDWSGMEWHGMPRQR